MNAHRGFVELSVPSEGLRAAPIVSDTYWGYVIRPAEPYLERAAWIEIVASFSGVLIFLSAYGQWLLPGSDLSPELLPMKLLATVLFAALGAGLIWIGRKGMVQEMHVDRVKSEIRLVQRNRRGEGRITGIIPFQDVASVILKRSKTPFSPSRLCLRLAQGGSFVEILISDESALLPIRDRLIVDMSPRFRPVQPRRRLRQRPAAA